MVNVFAWLWLPLAGGAAATAWQCAGSYTRIYHAVKWLDKNAGEWLAMP
jgi:hypothetical protein